MFEDRKVVIWGTGKFQQDFQYIFDDIHPAYYVTSDDSSSMAQLEGDKDKKNLLVIICDFNKDDIRNSLEKMGDFEYGKSFIYAEDIFPVLDEPVKLHLDGRKLAFWGTGTELYYFQENVDLDNDVYIDSDINKRNTCLGGKKIIYPNDIHDWGNYFIVITTLKYYPEISEILKSKGLQEGLDYIHYRKLLPTNHKLSELLKETIYAKPIQAPACTKPFDYLEIAFGGNLFCCCPAWVKYRFGDINTETCANVWHSMAAKIFRLSIINKTFCFCNWEACSHIDNKPLEDSSGERYTNLKLKEQPEQLLIGIDGRCNLNCRQCRKGFSRYDEVEENMLECQKYRIINSKWMENAKGLTFASYGEVFFSPIYKSLLFETVSQTKRDSISILSNGILFSEEYFQMLKKRYNKIYVSISVDAACEETYHIVRGGNWRKLNANLENLVSHRKAGEIEHIVLTFCTQLSNVTEIYDFIEYARNLGVDCVTFQKIHHTDDMTIKEFNEIFSITDDEGNLKKEVADILVNADLNDSFVDWHQLYKYIIDARKDVNSR